MDIREKINMDFDGLMKNGPITIVAFGDSVTHGALKETINYETVYWNLLKKKLNSVRDYIPVNVINSGIGGITAKGSLDRIERDVIAYHPDVVIVCFGLNDVNGELDDYLDSLRIIFEKIKTCNADIIFMTPNMLNTDLADDVQEEYKEYAKVTMEFQNNGKMDKYIYSAVEIAKKMNVKVCDCYSEWKKLEQKGENITSLLINRINHPIPEMHNLFADMLFDTIMGKDEIKKADDSTTMYKQN